jgi:hypothetical protein
MNHRVFVPAVFLLFASFAFAADDGRKELLIPADKLAAAEQSADTPTPGKWWMKRDAQDWGAKDGKILMAGKPSDEAVKSGFWEVIPAFRFTSARVPMLTIDPQATGWNRIYVGVYCDDIDYLSRPMIDGKLTGEPFAEYLEAPFAAKGRTAEVYWKAADLTGKKIFLGQPKGPMPRVGSGWMGGVTHVRIVPMSEKEVAEARKEVELPPADHRLFAMLDYTDEAFWWGAVEEEDDVRAMVYRHQQAGFGRVYWRCYGTCLDTSLSVPEAAPRWSAADDQAWCKKQQTQAGWLAYAAVTKEFDPLKVAVAYGNPIGCEVHAMVRFNNYNRAPMANFRLDHPEFLLQELASKKDPKTGNPVPIQPYKRVPNGRALSFAYPEVRTYYVKVFKQLASTGTRGIMIDMLRHPPIVGYEPITSDAFKKKYGKQMEPLSLYRDPEVLEHAASYLRLFLVELRQAIGPDIEISVRTSGPNGFGLRAKEFIDEGLINTIVDGHWYSGNGPRPTIDASVAAAGTKGKAFAAAESSDVNPAKNWQPRKNTPLSADAITALARAYSGRGVARFGIYESTIFTWFPDVRRAIRAAAWEYEPGKAGKAGK